MNTLLALIVALAPAMISERNGVYVATDRFPAACQGADDSLMFSFYSAFLPSGASLFLPAGTCLTSVGLSLGNGGPVSNSTKQGIKVIGQGSGFNEAELGPFVSTGTTVEWIGPYDRSASLIRFAGPGAGFRVEDISLNGRGNAGVGVRWIHVIHGAATRLTIRNFTVAGFIHESAAPPRSGMATGAGDATISKVQIFTSTPGAIGVIAGSDDTATTGSSGNHWDRVTVLCGNRAGTIGFLVRFTDYIKFSMPQTLFCQESMRFQPPARGASRTFFPTGIYVNDAAFDVPPSASADWSPYPNIGAVMSTYHREWNGGTPSLDSSYGPLFPLHPSIRGTDSLGNTYAPPVTTKPNGRSAAEGPPPTMLRRTHEPD